MTRPEVSVCLPAYRAEDYLSTAIESVLAQTHRDWELVVVDNASEDRTGDIAHAYDDPRIVVLTNPTTVSLQDNWNLAVASARGRFVKVLPADDLLRPTCLERQAAMLRNDDDLALVSARRDFIDPDGELVLRARGLTGLVGRRPSIDVVHRVMRSGINPIGDPAAMMFRRDDFQQAGHFDASLPFPMDLELAIRLLRFGDFYGEEQALSAFRVRPDSYTGSRAGRQGAEHRAVLRRVAADERWQVSSGELTRGVALTRVASLKRRLLFNAVSHRWRPIRRLPAYVLADAILREPSPAAVEPAEPRLTGRGDLAPPAVPTDTGP